MSVVYDWFVSTFHGLPRELAALIISMVPLVELRGGIIFSKLVDLELWRAALFCIIGNIIPRFPKADARRRALNCLLKKSFLVRQILMAL